MSVQIGPIAPRGVDSYSQDGAIYVFNGILTDKKQHDELKELCWGAEWETEERHIQGTAFYCVDYSLDQHYVQFFQFPASNNPKSGWYIIRRLATSADETARGFSFSFSLETFFLGTNATLKDGFKLMGLGVERNSWGI